MLGTPYLFRKQITTLMGLQQGVMRDWKLWRRVGELGVGTLLGLVCISWIIMNIVETRLKDALNYPGH